MHGSPLLLNSFPSRGSQTAGMGINHHQETRVKFYFLKILQQGARCLGHIATVLSYSVRHLVTSRSEEC